MDIRIGLLVVVSILDAQRLSYAARVSFAPPFFYYRHRQENFLIKPRLSIRTNDLLAAPLLGRL
jgi:hypothetical protein